MEKRVKDLFWGVITIIIAVYIYDALKEKQAKKKTKAKITPETPQTPQLAVEDGVTLIKQ